MRKSFSVLEIVFAIVIISIISSVAIPKIFSSVGKSNIIKLKSDVILIQSSINDYVSNRTILEDDFILEDLDDSDDLLFSIILDVPIVSKEATGSWTKSSNNIYNAWISSDKSVKFKYKESDFSFKCDFKDDDCRELTK